MSAGCRAARPHGFARAGTPRQQAGPVRTRATSVIPTPRASAPSAPCIEVWLSPQTMMMPGWPRPASGPKTCTRPGRSSCRPNRVKPYAAAFRSGARWRASRCRSIAKAGAEPSCSRWHRIPPSATRPGSATTSGRPIRRRRCARPPSGGRTARRWLPCAAPSRRCHRNSRRGSAQRRRRQAPRPAPASAPAPRRARSRRNGRSARRVCARITTSRVWPLMEARVATSPDVTARRSPSSRHPPPAPRR